jgi:serine/threonine protein phosphatase PrpC
VFQDGMENVGSTAMVVLFDGDKRFFLASLGDCRAVLCRDGKACEVSAREHKASRPDEVARVCFQQVRGGRGRGGGCLDGQRRMIK